MPEDSAMIHSHSVLPAALVLGLSATAWSMHADALPTPSDAMALQQLAEKWLVLGSIPQNVRQQLPVEKAVGVVVTLRLEGEFLSQGQALNKDVLALLEGKEVKSVDLVPLLADASNQAFEKANKRLKSQGDDSAYPLDTKADRVCVDIQVGYAPTPVLISKEGAAEEVFARVIPGYHGVALWMPIASEPEGSFAWPASIMAEGLSVDSAVRHLIFEQKINATDAKKIARPGGPRLNAFEVLHVTRARRDLPAMLLTRGAVLVPQSAMTPPVLRTLSTRVVEHLLSKVTPEGTLRGGYHPAGDLWSPEVAPPAEAALVAYALVRAASRIAVHGTPLEEQCIKSAAALLHKLVPLVSDTKVASQPLTAGLMLLALSDASISVDKNLRDKLAADLMAIDSGDRGYQVKVEDKEVALGATSSAIITCALAAWVERTHDAKAQALVSQKLEKTFALSEGMDTPEALYWIALTEQFMRNNPEHKVRVKQMMEDLNILRQSQIDHAPEVGPADVVGGFIFNKNNLPLPTWRSAFVMALWGNLRQNPQDFELEKAKHELNEFQSGARFLAQLVVTPPACFACRNPAAAVGGVRGAPWEAQLDTQPAVMTLIAFEEILAALK